MKHELIFVSGCDMIVETMWVMPWTSEKKIKAWEQKIINYRTAQGWKLYAYSV